MNWNKLTEVEEKLIEKYQLTKDQDIAVYFFNKLGKEVLNILYSKVTLKFSSIPFEKEDLTSYVWKSLKNGLEMYKSNGNLFNIWIKNSYFIAIKEIKKYFKNTELILNHAQSLETYQQNHSMFSSAKASITFQKQSFKEIMKPIIDYVSKHTKKYGKTDIKKLLYLKSFGYSEREIAKKMNVSRRYISSMIKIVLRISKRYLLNTSNR